MAGRVKHNSNRVITKSNKTRWYKEQKPAVEIDWTVVAQMDAKVDGNKLPATGKCHDCDKSISGERRFCGTCAARREGVY